MISRRFAPYEPELGARAWAARVAVCVCLGVLALVAPCAQAKKPKLLPTKTISGLVLNQSGRGINGASVLLTDLASKQTQAIYSGASGAYNFSGLIPYDNYKILARYQGAESDVRYVSSADTRAQIVVNLTVASSGSKPMSGKHD
jgi:hypothetical protein